MRACVVGAIKECTRNEELGGDPVAPPFDPVGAALGEIYVITPPSPTQTCASSWASVKICAALVSLPFTNTTGA